MKAFYRSWVERLATNLHIRLPTDLKTIECSTFIHLWQSVIIVTIKIILKSIRQLRFCKNFLITSDCSCHIKGNRKFVTLAAIAFFARLYKIPHFIVLYK